MNSYPHTYWSDPTLDANPERQHWKRSPVRRRESWSLYQTAVTAVLVEALLKFTSLPRTCRVLGIILDVGTESRTNERTRSSGRPPLYEAREVSSIHDQVERVYTRLPLSDTCLRRALTAGFRLRSFKPRLMLGVRRDRTLAAHAWLEVDGVVLDWANTYRDYVRLSS